MPLVCFEIIPTIGEGLYFEEGFFVFFGDSLTGGGTGRGSSAFPFASKISRNKNIFLLRAQSSTLVKTLNELLL